MKNVLTIPKASKPKKGYNEKNPTEPEGAFPPDAANHRPKKKDIKSNSADKKLKEDTN